MQGNHSKRISLASSPIAILTDSMNGGGAEIVALRLAEGFVEKGHEVDLLLITPQGEHQDKIFSRLSIYYIRSKTRSSDLLDYLRSRRITAKKLKVNPLHEPSAKRTLADRYPSCRITRLRVRRALAVSRYIHLRKPKMMLSLLHTSNMAAINGRCLAKASYPLIVSIHNNIEIANPEDQSEISEAYPSADAIVCVSHGAAEAAIRTCNLPPAKTSVIYNPIPHRKIYLMSQDEISHPWFLDDRIPVIFTIGRITPQKDLCTLVSAFSLICRKREARLAMMTNATVDEANALLAQVARYGLRKKFDIIGFDPNPFRYLRRADCFVLSSRFEGMSNVLPEAMACGTPIVSTDAPYGPREILEGGTWGKLTEVGNPEKLATAILETLDANKAERGHAMERARFFCAGRATREYLALMHKLFCKN